jgi:nitroimidazol reductase NimA-like FMN-containing flavoprotein (pyridoxamine 5'-phosphate oxidase superfamily)
MDEAEALSTLGKAEWGVLATVDAEGWPYAVPLNHVVVDGALILHSAREGHKLRNLQANERVSYCVVTEAEPVPLELATRYESAVAFGRARLITEDEEKRAALRALGLRFAPQHPEVVDAELARDAFRTAVLCITLERVTGKARR